MITNRTINDVNLAKKIRAEKIQKGFEITDNEVETMERGCVTINTLNRIEQKQSELKTKLNDMGYFDTNISNVLWNYTDIFNEHDFKRIIDNNIVLRKAFFVYLDTPKVAIAKYHYDQFNRLEKVLVDLETNINYTINHYRRCGTFNCGE